LRGSSRGWWYKKPAINDSEEREAEAEAKEKKKVEPGIEFTNQSLRRRGYRGRW